MKRVFVCSPYRGDRDRNDDYLAACMADSLSRGEAPFAPHALYPGYLDDDIPEQRAAGIRCGVAWLENSDIIAVYCDLGVSAGMEAEIAIARQLGVHIENRSLVNWND